MGVFRELPWLWAVFKKNPMSPSAVKGRCHGNFLKNSHEALGVYSKTPMGRHEYTGGVMGVLKSSHEPQFQNPVRALPPPPPHPPPVYPGNS
jgi:hypothetical protein